MAKIVFPNEIVLEEVDGGLLVRQGDEVYIARNWVLTEPVIVGTPGDWSRAVPARA